MVDGKLTALVCVAGTLAGIGFGMNILPKGYIRIRNPEKTYVHEIKLRKEDMNKNKLKELVVNIKGEDYHVKKTEKGYELVPFKVESVTESGKTIHEIIDMPYNQNS